MVCGILSMCRQAGRPAAARAGEIKGETGMIRNLVRRMMALLCAAVIVQGCGEPSGPLKIGTNVWPGYEPGYLARDLGYFSDSDIKLLQFQSATESIRAFRNGVVDVAALTLDEALLLQQDGIDIRIFLVADVSHGGDVIMARPDVGSMDGLKGKTVGVENSALGAYVLARALEIHGVALKDVTIRPITVDQSEDMYLLKAVDAVVTFEPFRSRLLKAGAVEIFTSREMPNEIVDVLVVRSDVIDRFKDQLHTLSAAWLKAVAYINEQPDEAGVMLGKRLGLAPDEALASFEGLVIPDAALNRELLSAGPSGLMRNAAKLKAVLLENKLLAKDVDLGNVFSDMFVKD